MKINEWTEKMYEIWRGFGQMYTLYRRKYAQAISKAY